MACCDEKRRKQPVHASFLCFRLASVIKMYGAQLKASAATIRLRLYDVLSLLPPESFDGEGVFLHYFDCLHLI